MNYKIISKMKLTKRPMDLVAGIYGLIYPPLGILSFIAHQLIYGIRKARSKKLINIMENVKVEPEEAGSDYDISKGLQDKAAFGIGLAKADWVKRNFNTPLEVAAYCKYYLEFEEDVEDKVRNKKLKFSEIHRSRKTNCRGFTIAAAAILENNGFPPYALDIATLPCWGTTAGLFKYPTGHITFVYKTKAGRFGSVGANCVDTQPPIYETVGDLADVICKELYPDWKYTYWNVVDLRKGYPNFNK